MARGFTVTKEALVGALVGGACDPRKAAMVEFLISSPRCDPIRHCFEYAATRPGGAKVLQWHGDATYDPTANASIIESIAREAFSRAHLDTLKWLHVARAAVPPSQSVHHPSTQENLLHFHEWRLQVGLTDWTGEDMGLAIHHGYLDVIQWLHSHSTIGFTTRAMDAAAANGHLTVVKWLHEHSAVGCTTAAMDNAASQGHLAVVQWLHRNRMDGCTKEAVSLAAHGGHLEVVQWLCQNRTEHNAMVALVEAARRGHLTVLEWLHETQTDGCTSCAITAVLTDYGCVLHSLDGLQWLHEHPSAAPCAGRCGEPEKYPCWVGRHAMEEGDLNMLKFVMEHYPETAPTGGLQAVMDSLASQDMHLHPGIVAWIEARQTA